MTLILGIETSGEACSICLGVDGNRFESTRHVDRRHNELLLPMIAEVFERAGCHLSDLEAIAFNCGPGSFTGVRIAAAAVQAIALTAGIPVVRISASMALAEAGLEKSSSPSPVMVTSIRSRGEFYYLAAYRRGDAAGVPVAVHDDALHGNLPDDQWFRALSTAAPGSIRGVGDRPAWWEDRACPLAGVERTAAVVCSLAARKLAQHGGMDAAAALPLYVTGDSPWQRT